MKAGIKEVEELTKKILDSITQVFDGNERIGMIVSVAHIDDLMRTILEKCLTQVPKGVFSYPGILSSLSSKIIMAYALGLIDEESRKLLDDMRDVRNKSAHKVILNLEPGDTIHSKMKNIEKVLKKSDIHNNLLKQLLDGNVPEFKASLIAISFTIILKLEIAAMNISHLNTGEPLSIAH